MASSLRARNRARADRQGARAAAAVFPVLRRSAARACARDPSVQPGIHPMSGLDVVELSRLQFALTALYHFLFVPLTLGLSVILAIMESVYVMTGRRIWRDITMF